MLIVRCRGCKQFHEAGKTYDHRMLYGDWRDYHEWPNQKQNCPVCNRPGAGLMAGDKRSLEDIAATGSGWCTEVEFADLIAQIRAARAHLKAEGSCVVCWTASWEPVDNQEDCAIEHPHPEEDHIRCGHCALIRDYKNLVDAADRASKERDE